MSTYDASVISTMLSLFTSPGSGSASPIFVKSVVSIGVVVVEIVVDVPWVLLVFDIFAAVVVVVVEAEVSGVVMILLVPVVTLVVKVSFIGMNGNPQTRAYFSAAEPRLPEILKELRGVS